MMLALTLGANVSRNTSIGDKAKLLDWAKHRGLPVPKGVILTHEAFQLALSQKAIDIKNESVVASNPYHLLAVIGAPPFRGLVAVRSAFSVEDGQETSLAGFFTSKLFVPRNNAETFAEALCAVWSSAFKRAGQFRRDVLVMEMVEAKHSGVAFTESDYEDDSINFVSGVAERLVSGRDEGETMLLPKLNFYESEPINNELPNWAKRLQQLLKRTRHIFGNKNWDIEWADDGVTCWLIQIRPITRSARRNEAFTIANHKEILPELPSTFMTSLIAACSKELFGYYRKFDASLPEQRLFIEIFIGRPFINLSLMTDMMRHWGLPTKLVTDSIGGEAGEVFDANWLRLFFNFPKLARQGLAQFASARLAKLTVSKMHARSASDSITFADAIETMQRHYADLVKEMFSLTAAISLPMALLRRLGTLEEHQSRHETIATKLFSDLAPLREIARQKSAVAESLKKNELPSDADFQTEWKLYLNKHGHRGIYESDIARPRFIESPQSLFPAILQPTSKCNLPPRTLAGLFTFPIWKQAAAAINAREELRYNAMLAFQKSRSEFLRLAEKARLNGQLPKADWIWHLSIQEIMLLDGGATYDQAFFATRFAEMETLKNIPAPDFFRRFDDLENHQTQLPAASRLSGVSLSTGDLIGEAWVLREPSTDLPEGFEKSKTILVARSVDAGWIPTFSLVSGVVVETGGDLSHGSIILRELGLPAVTNVQGATLAIQTRATIRLRASEGRVEMLAP